LGFGIIKRHPSDPLEGYLINQINPITFLFSYRATQSGMTFFLIINSPFLYKNLTQIILINVKWIR
jgi:hypothetical protein